MILTYFNLCSNSPVTVVSTDLGTAEVTRLQSLVSAKDAEIEQLRAEIEGLRACMPTTTDAVRSPTSVEAIVSTYNTTTIDNLACSDSSQTIQTLISTAGDETSQYLETRQRVKARILSAWTSAGFDK